MKWFAIAVIIAAILLLIGVVAFSLYSIFDAHDGRILAANGHKNKYLKMIEAFKMEKTEKELTPRNTARQKATGLLIFGVGFLIAVISAVWLTFTNYGPGAAFFTFGVLLAVLGFIYPKL